MTGVSKQYVLVFYSKIAKLISFKKFNNFALLNPFNILILYQMTKRCNMKVCYSVLETVL